MTAATSTSLTAFLERRLAEDEAAAVAVQDERPDGRPSRAAWQVARLDEPLGSFVLRNSPNRVLAEVEAKRAIVATCAEDIDAGRYVTSGALLGDEVLRHLAAPYRDHPEFDKSWKV